MPRLRLSTDQLQFILWMLKDLGIKDVPSLKSLRSVQETLRKDIGIVTSPKVAPSGNIFYMNNVPSLIALVSYVLEYLNTS